uniref:ATP synthase complex subunit 8 n=1 Tax=Zenkerella insignis TaxID=101669 RepID=A0A343EVU4_9RODE|nr:ATP synthase F0 subunit 8 [Zenkerella insignis]ASM91480.1 ATP synthase subunit 8 [Zenkerella insignis]
MPQLDTSTWFTIIMTTTITLFMIFQMKMITFSFWPKPEPKNYKTCPTNNPWKSKWTKTYLPPSLPLQ